MLGESYYGTGHPLGASFVKRFENLPLNCSVALQESPILLTVRFGETSDSRFPYDTP